MRRPILNHLRRGEVVYDCFLGSGTTLAAAEMTERVCYGLGRDPKYVDVVVLRWQSLSGKEAALDGDGRTFAPNGLEPKADARRNDSATRAQSGNRPRVGAHAGVPTVHKQRDRRYC
jgi:hypothetical protein